VIIADQNVPTYYFASVIIKEKCIGDKITNSKISPTTRKCIVIIIIIIISSSSSSSSSNNKKNKNKNNNSSPVNGQGSNYSSFKNHTG